MTDINHQRRLAGLGEFRPLDRPSRLQAKLDLHRELSCTLVALQGQMPMTYEQVTELTERGYKEIDRLFDCDAFDETWPTTVTITAP